MAMLGRNAPAQYSVHLSNQAAPEKQTSTEELRAALTRLRLKANGAKPEPPPAEEEQSSGPH
jgi:hypothetical protein